MLTTWAWIETSSADTGSSAMINSGSTASALAIPILCLCPPDNFEPFSPILLLDEATAYADSDNEVLMQKAILELSKNKTTIMIAHRLSTIVNVDCIYVVEDGTIVESGNHQQLIEANGIYADMWNNYCQSIDWKVGEIQ